MNKKSTLKQDANLVPPLPGVYYMKDYFGSIIYIGKSKCLKKRVTSYFNAAKNKQKKIKRMISSIETFTYTITDTELDALLLECREIKRWQPIYNTLLKNDKKYKFLFLSLNTTYPRVEVAYERKDEGEYYGPYDKPNMLTRIAEILNEYYQLPTCNKMIEPIDCIKYQLGYCIGACKENNEISLLYEEKIQDLRNFLKGNTEDIIMDLEEKMKQASIQLRFEKAIEYRENMKLLASLNVRKKAIEMHLKCQKGIGFVSLPIGGIKVYFFVGTKIVDSICYLREQLQGNQKIISKMLATRALESLKGNDEQKNYLNKEEIDEALIVYRYFATSQHSYYIKLQSIEEPNIITLAELLHQHISKLVKDICFSTFS